MRSRNLNEIQQFKQPKITHLDVAKLGFETRFVLMDGSTGSWRQVCVCGAGMAAAEKV